MKNHITKALLIILIIFTCNSYIFSQTLNDSTKSIQIYEINIDTLEFGSLVEENKPTLIVFWATWAQPAIVASKQISQKFEDWKGNYNVNVFNIHILDEAISKGQIIMTTKSARWNFKTYWDFTGKLSKTFETYKGLPVILLFDKNKQVVYNKSGYAPHNLDEIESILNSISR